MSLFQFRVLQAVARQGGLAAAAPKLNRSTSAISLSLKQLETEVGGSLFEGDRKSKLTPLGRCVVDETRPLLEHYDRVVGSIRQRAVGGPGRLDIACVPSIAATVVPEAIASIWKNQPGAQIEVRDIDSHSVAQAVMLGTVEIGLASLVGRTEELVATPLFSDPLDVVCSVSDPLGATSQLLRWEEVRKRPFLANGSYGAGPSKPLEEMHANRIMYIANVISLQAAVRANIGITILPRLMRDSAMPGVKFVPLADTTARRTVHVIRRKQHQLSSLATRFLAILRDALKTGEADLGIKLYDSEAWTLPLGANPG